MPETSVQTRVCELVQLTHGFRNNGDRPFLSSWFFVRLKQAITRQIVGAWQEVISLYL